MMVLPHPQHPPLTHKAASAFRSCRPTAPAPTPATTASPHIDRVSLPRRHPKLCKPQCMLRGTLGFCSPQLSSQDVLHNLQVGDLLSRPLYLSGSCGPLRFDDGCDLSQRGHLIMQTLCCLPLSNSFRSVGTVAAAAFRARRSSRAFRASSPSRSCAPIRRSAVSAAATAR